MRSSAAPSLFQKKKQPDQARIPVMSAAEKANQLSGENILFRMNYIYDNARAKRHTDAQTILQTLYHIGAELINTGKAYSADVKLPTFNTDNIKPTPRSLPSKQEAEISDLLMSRYNKLPAYTHHNGRHSATNPFHALFVMRVALDHVEPESIYLMYTALNISSYDMTMMPNKISFPNGSEFLGDYATLQVLRGYILNHQNSHFGFLNEQDLLAVANTSNPFASSYISIANTDQAAQVDRILGESVLRPMHSLKM